MAKRSVRIQTPGLAAMAEALQDVGPKMERAVHRALRESLKPPPPGFVRVNLSLVVAEALLADEPALGAFLVSHVKKGLHRG